MTRRLIALAVLGTLTSVAGLDAQTVTGGKHDLTNVVCTIPLPNGAAVYNVVELPGGKSVPAQVAKPPLHAKAGDAGGLVFVLPEIKAGETIAVKHGTVTFVKAPPQFAFKQVSPEYADLTFDGRKVLRYMNAPRDGSSKDAHELTFKPFHHVFDPATGETLLTNGAGLAADKSLLYPHHRGLFFAFNRISYGDQSCDTWHGRNGEYTLHQAVVGEESGQVLGRHRARLSWHGRDGKPFADELRELTAFNVPGGTLIEFASALTTMLPKVRLDGDPQHAGFHFRAAMEVAKNGKQNTYYLRPDGKGKIGETRNWDPKTKKGPVNLPWDACSFVVGGKRYTLLRLNHPDNPGEARGSERDYGRFGDYFEYDLTPEKPLRVKYRVWVQEGEMTVKQCENLHSGFVNPPAVK